MSKGSPKEKGRRKKEFWQGEGEAARTPRFCPAVAGHAYAWIFAHAKAAKDARGSGGIGFGMFNFRLKKRYSCPAVSGRADAWIFTHAKAAKDAKEN